jgi:hypothetical protein
VATFDTSKQFQPRHGPCRRGIESRTGDHDLRLLISQATANRNLVAKY